LTNALVDVLATSGLLIKDSKDGIALNSHRNGRFLGYTVEKGPVNRKQNSMFI
jgi:hypothetical protein